MIALRQLFLSRGGRVLLSGVDLAFHKGQKIGIVGANGSGKSTFFALIRGLLHPEAGDIRIPTHAVIAHVEQEVAATTQPAIEYVIDGDAELRAIEKEIGHASGEKLALAHVRMEEVGGYTAKVRASVLLHGLGFKDGEFSKAVSEFSGGWRMRLNLARALMCRSDILLLDEPTNHLDLDAVFWLEDWLKSYQGMLLLISHDRDFLDNTVTHICHLEQQKLLLYSGNYADFERQRAANLARQQSSFEKQQREISHLNSYIERFRAKATKARQAQSRIKALERMEVIAAAHVDSPFSFSFADPLPASDPLLLLEEVSAGYADKTVLQGIDLAVTSGDRIGLVGRNGAGKSTLVKLIAGVLPAVAGKRIEGKGLKIGYFAQHQLESLRPDESPLQHMIRLDKSAREADLRSFLGGFDFRGDDAFAPVSSFSGGERARLALALIIRGRPNLLLLDEPTNHLDLQMRDALNLALQDFTGAMVLVSHDRHLLKTSVDKLFLVDSGGISEFEGDLDLYREKVRTPVEKKNDRRNERRSAAALRQLRRPLELAMKKLEEQMDLLEKEKEEIEAMLGDSGFYEDKIRLNRTLKRQAEIVAKLSAIEDEWFELNVELESMDDLGGVLEVQ